ncbi:hypothetical protein BP6252_08157 [Coleophoma cylindrospora]|uniref:DNA 3'-5' helicase n=1 Tax=Coleophoma cylindrospora TaxID=1849047 RepID=A0A3D8RCJ9_9HELO|nr:hypothetical protein BP6252_08157 [Coleophoma cylindrospora]
MDENDEDDFGFSSGDEAALLATSEALEKGTKRKNTSFEDLSRSKKPATNANPVSDYLPLASAALTKTFGFKGFQLKQEQVVTRILGGESAVVVFPTGGGKSLCFQIPALVFADVDAQQNIRGPGEHGITLVVSPLIALMKDQVDALKRRGVAAATLDSTKTREEYLDTCDKLRQGHLKILYCAPERLNNEGFVEQMKFVRGGIRLLAVDEAHCISEWGHAFRPDYLKISRFVDEINAERVVCLTATATPRVAKDICDAFGIEITGLFRTSTYRPNLHLLAESAPTKQKLYPKLFQFLRANPGATIVYVTLQKETEALASELRTQGFKARAFHAGMQADVKQRLQDEFMACEDLIIVATIAFGMGIDKAMIRNVVHFNIPSSLESYSQEIGRAGRDGQISRCMFYVCSEDLHLRELFARGDLASKESVRGLLNEIFDDETTRFPVGGQYKANHALQTKEFDIRATTLKNIYAQLELRHGLLREITPIYTKYTYTAGASFSATLAHDTSPAARAIGKYGKRATKWYNIDVDFASKGVGIPRNDVIKKLNQWNEEGGIELKPSGVVSVYRILKPLPKTSSEIGKLVDDIFTLMQEREAQAMQRTDEVLELITGSDCFARKMAQHFGDDLPGGIKECRHCTWCLTHKPVAVEPAPPMSFNKVAFNSILERVPDRDDARFLARIAFGISSPRVTAMKLGRDPLFGSMGDHEFTVCPSFSQGISEM